MKLKAKIILLSFLTAVLSVATLISFTYFGNQQINFNNYLQIGQLTNCQTFDVSSSKIYSYEITQTGTSFTVSGTYENNETYILSQNTVFENIIMQIDQDRILNNIFEDCSINFNNITLGNSFLTLTNGTYILSGNLTSQSLSTFGLIYINGANVEICNAQFTNNGSACLIRNDSSGDLEIFNSTLTANDKTIFNNDGGDISIFGGKVESKNTFAIFSSGTASINIQQSSSLNPTEIIGNSESFGAIYASGGNINIMGGSITNLANGYAVYSENAVISFANSPIFLTTGNQIYTQIKTVGQVNGQYYTGELLSIMFGGQITSGVSILVEGTNEINKSKFEILNANYNTKFIDSNLIIYQIFSLLYNSNAAGITAPTDTNKYFINDIITLQFLETDIRAGYIFLGWAEINNAISATYTENGETQLVFANQTLFAVWQAIEYDITYILSGGDWAENVVVRNVYTCQTARFVLPKPIKEYYTYLGWTCENDSRLQIPADTINNPNKAVETGTIGNLIFTAHFELTIFNINYNGLTSQMIASLNLTTGFTIESPSITIASSDFLYNGYSFFGIYTNAEKTENFSGEVAFDITAHNTIPEMFDANGDINFYITTKIFHNGQGNGTLENPYKLSTFSQFEAFLSGYKKPTTNKTYIVLANDISFSSQVSSSIFEPLSNFDINGNNYIINISKYNTYNNYTSLFPYLKNCNLHDINFNSLQKMLVDFAGNSIINFANIVGLAEKTNLKNLKNFINAKLINTGTTQIINFRAGGIVLDFNGEYNTINNCQNYGNLEIFIQNSNDININCGMIAGLTNNSMIINSANFGNAKLIATLSNPNIFETRSFASGIAILEKDSIVINSYNQGDITLEEETNNLAVASGVAIVFNTGCNLYNNYNLGDISVKGTYANNIAQPIVWAGSISYNTDNCYYVGNNSQLAQKDFTNGKVLRYLNGYLPNLTTILENDFLNFSAHPNDWYYGFDLAPQFEETILVNYNLNGITENKSVVYYAGEDIESKYIPVSYRQNFFDGWFTTASYSQTIDFDSLTGPSITFFAKWTPLTTYVNTNFVKYIVLNILIFIIFLTALYFFDKKKTVNFFNNGKLIAIAKVARAKPIILPEGFENIVWFEDVRGTKPFINKKMTYKKLSLYTFNDSKQQRMESKYYNDLDKIKQQTLQRAQEKQRQLEEKQAKLLQLKEQKLKLKAEKKKLQAENKQSKQKIKAEIQAQKAKQQQEKAEQTKTENAIDDRITIIKKEIKIIKTNEDN